MIKIQMVSKNATRCAVFCATDKFEFLYSKSVATPDNSMKQGQ
ncbi:Uncharacterized protein APZ42_008549 [Daphnia magna]|uniref:Uncharacterized protein n=1 Tax=Daphnia magna TaxID=35525 RepID=A0A164EKC1_9CRUS|nr:Uncharacterized protein APZ42_008549 [Daphnia magna]